MRKLDYPFEDYKSALSKTMRTEREMLVFLALPQRANGICGHRALAAAEWSKLWWSCGICEQFVVEAFKNFD